LSNVDRSFLKAKKIQKGSLGEIDRVFSSDQVFMRFKLVNFKVEQVGFE